MKKTNYFKTFLKIKYHPENAQRAAKRFELKTAFIINACERD